MDIGDRQYNRGPTIMTDSSTHHIWNPTTGIVDMEETDPDELQDSQISGIKAIWQNQKSRLKETSQLSDFTEKLSREWAIETGVIENLYEIERGVTQTLIEHGFQAELLAHGSTDKPQQYVLALLRDQKEALDGVFDFVRSRRALSVGYIRELHAALLRSQDVTEAIDSPGRSVEVPVIRGDWKTQPNSPWRDGIQYLYCPPEQVASEMDRLISIHSQHIDKDIPSEIQAAWFHHRFSQIHPFQDGNGRVARALASLILVKDGLFPLVITRDDKPKYLKALEEADDGKLKPLINMIVTAQVAQFRKASAISEAVLAEDDVNAALDGLHRAADKIAADKLAELRGVFDLAETIQVDLDERLATIGQQITGVLQKVTEAGSAYVNKSTQGTDHYFRAQIIENAKSHLHYYADTAEYRCWISLNMNWSRRAKLVFTVHGVGKPFNGSLVCSPFLEFMDADEEGESRNSLVPVAEEGFVFFYTEKADRLLERFRPWRENTLKIALKELTRNL